MKAQTVPDTRGLVPAISLRDALCPPKRDRRDKPGDDDGEGSATPDLASMRRHRYEDRRLARVLHSLADRLVIGAVRLQVDIVAVIALDDVVIGLAAPADQPVILEPDVHVSRHELCPILDVGLEHRLIDVLAGELDDTGGFRRARR